MSGMQGAMGAAGGANASTPDMPVQKDMEKMGNKPKNTSRRDMMDALSKLKQQTSAPTDSGYSP